MTDAPEKKTKLMPKGGRKGGTSFPRVSLEDALSYAKRLVAKTHTGPQTRDVVYAAIVNAKSGTGNIRISALRQYGLLTGDEKSKFSATDLAKRIGGAPEDEMLPLLRQAALKPSVFKKIFDTYHGDAITKAKLRQRALDLAVHPEEAEKCVDLYVSSLATAGLVTIDGDKVAHVASLDVDVPPVNVDEVASREPNGDVNGDTRDEAHVHTNREKVESNGVDTGQDTGSLPQSTDTERTSPRAVFHINLTLDSSLDSEKLEKQLELLKRYGAI